MRLNEELIQEMLEHPYTLKSHRKGYAIQSAYETASDLIDEILSIKNIEVDYDDDVQNQFICDAQNALVSKLLDYDYYIEQIDKLTIERDFEKQTKETMMTQVSDLSWKQIDADVIAQKVIDNTDVFGSDADDLYNRVVDTINEAQQ